jgi:phage baseplate assembly protein W
MTKRQGISPKIPLSYDVVDGPYRLNRTLGETIKQNFKNMVLTMPGERIMIPEFGVGLYGYLFENVNGNTFDALVERLTEQTQTYMPMINLQNIDFLTSDEDPSLSFNEVRVSIKYNILPLDEDAELLITSTMTT